MEKDWRVFELRNFGGRFIEKRGDLLTIFDEERGIIIHYPEKTAVDLEKLEGDIKKYVELKRKWGSKYLEVYEEGTEIVNASVIIAVDHFGRERTVIM